MNISDSITKNSVAVVFTADNEGLVDVTVVWQFEEDTDDSIAHTLIALAYGIAGSYETSFEEFCELGISILDAEEIIGDDSDLEGIDEHLIVFQPSDYKQ